MRYPPTPGLHLQLGAPSRRAKGARGRVHRRCLASRDDVVLNVMPVCLASSREAL